MKLPQRKWLRHDTPPWVDVHSTFFLTLCGETKGKSDMIQPPSKSEAILNAFPTYHSRRIWWVDLVLIMPDHLHALIQPGPTTDLNQSVKNLKSFLKRKHQLPWQDGWFDHRIRNSESYRQKFEYILNNPVRKGLVKKWEDWPHLDFPGRKLDRN